MFLAAPAAAGDTGPAVGVPREAIAGTNAAPRRIDYDAPRPNVELLDHVRAVANLSFQNWFLWQLS